MITQDDIEAMRDDPQPQVKEFCAVDPVCKLLQWEVRSAFEAGYMPSGVDKGRSSVNPDNGKWFDHWLSSRHRAFLIRSGLMYGEEGYK